MPLPAALTSPWPSITIIALSSNYVDVIIFPSCLLVRTQWPKKTIELLQIVNHIAGSFITHSSNICSGTSFKWVLSSPLFGEITRVRNSVCVHKIFHFFRCNVIFYSTKIFAYFFFNFFFSGFVIFFSPSISWYNTCHFNFMHKSTGSKIIIKIYIYKILVKFLVMEKPFIDHFGTYLF